MDKIKNHIVILAFAIVIFLPLSAGAYKIEALPNIAVSGDYVLNQTKTEVKLDPGEKSEKSITIVNRSGQDLSFALSVEDFSATAKANENIELLGNNAGSYSLKDYLKPEASSFILHHGEQMTMPVYISLPENAQPGALYGAVIIAAKPANAGINTSNKVNVVSRLASLFFVRINGAVVEEGRLLNFGSSKGVYFGDQIAFEFHYKNSGTVYLNPYGELKVSDIFGRQVYAQWISPYFVLPGGIRQSRETLDRPLFGLYRATLKLNRGYGNIIDEKSQYFIVLSWKFLAAAAAIFIVFIGLIIKIRKNIRKAKMNNAKS